MKVTDSCQVSIYIEKFYRDLLPAMLWIWTCAIFFWEGRRNMILMLPKREGITYMCFLGRARELP